MAAPMPGAHGVPVVMAQPVAPPPQPARQPAATDAKKYRVFAKTIWYTQAALSRGSNVFFGFFGRVLGMRPWSAVFGYIRSSRDACG